VVPRSWLVVPLAGLASGALALVARTPLDALALALVGAAIAAAVRALTGGSGAAIAAAGSAALLAALQLLALPGELARPALAGAAAMFAIAELVRPAQPTDSPWPAIGAAIVAGTLEPSYTPLVAISGWKMIRAPWPRPRYALAVPLAGVLGAALAIAAAVIPRLEPLWLRWAGAAPHARAAANAAQIASKIGDGIGPVVAITAIAGLAIAATRGRYARLAILGVTVAALAVDARRGSLGAPTASCAALATGVAIGRLSAMIRLPAGQLAVSATTGFVLLVAPAISWIS
jgi:hypothetical protein